MSAVVRTTVRASRRSARRASGQVRYYPELVTKPTPSNSSASTSSSRSGKTRAVERRVMLEALEADFPGVVEFVAYIPGRATKTGVPGVLPVYVLRVSGIEHRLGGPELDAWVGGFRAGATIRR